MSQESNLQAFKLPHPILCIGGILKIELLDLVQKQAMDGLYYICVRHVQVIGSRVSPLLDVVTSADRTVLRYHPQAGTTSATAELSEGFSSNDDARSPWQTLTGRFRQFHALFGGVPVQILNVEDDDDDDDDDDGDGAGDDGDDGDYDLDMLDVPEEEPDA